jgi:hypothetical protein
VSTIDTAQRTCRYGSQLPGGSGVALLLLRAVAEFFGIPPVEQLAEGRYWRVRHSADVSACLRIVGRRLPVALLLTKVSVPTLSSTMQWSLCKAEQQVAPLTVSGAWDCEE